MRSCYLQISSAGTFGCLEHACSLCVRMQQDGIFELAVRCRCCSVVLKLVKMWMFIKKSDEELILKLMKKYILISLHPLLACGNIRNPSLNVIFDSFFTSSISSALDGWAALLRKPLQFTPGEDWIWGSDLMIWRDGGMIRRLWFHDMGKWSDDLERWWHDKMMVVSWYGEVIWWFGEMVAW